MKNLKDIESLVRGKSIALVGNSQKVIGKCYAVDDHDVVIRMNSAWNLPEELKKSVGSRLDILCVSGGKKQIDFLANKFPHVVWMSPKSRDLLSSATANALYFYPVDWWQPLHDKLGARPSTGCMAVDMLSKFIGSGKLTLYGFDFFKNASWHKRYSIKDRINIWLGKEAHVHPHEGDREEVFIRNCLPEDQLNIIKPE